MQRSALRLSAALLRHQSHVATFSDGSTISPQGSHLQEIKPSLSCSGETGWASGAENARAFTSRRNPSNQKGPGPSGATRLSTRAGLHGFQRHQTGIRAATTMASGRQGRLHRGSGAEAGHRTRSLRVTAFHATVKSGTPRSSMPRGKIP
jgi:hypothetical protein